MPHGIQNDLEQTEQRYARSMIFLDNSSQAKKVIAERNMICLADLKILLNEQSP
jgi:hypothetical protein